METSTWLPLQAIGTMVIVIAFAWWSWRRTRRMKEEHRPRQPSALARTTPDPQFTPDPEVTDPYHVTGAHHDPDRPAAPNPVDNSRPDDLAGRPPVGQGSARRHENADERPAGERLDGGTRVEDGAARQGEAPRPVRPQDAR